MGFTPQQVGEMSVWQFMAAVAGYAKANGADGSERPSDEFLDWADASAIVLFQHGKPGPRPCALHQYIT